MASVSTPETALGRAPTLADLLPLERLSPATRDVLLVAGGALLTGVAAQLAFSVPWTPVPYTLQTGAVLLVGTALGAMRGVLSMLFYVLLGAAGLPMFSQASGGVDHLLGATGGYLIGFIAAAALVGKLAEDRWDRTGMRAAGLMLAGTLVIYAMGVPVLALAYPMDFGTALRLGALVFVPWDVAKVVAAALLLPLAWRLAGTPRD
jgi:biotin transport system substrate-specific component